MVRPGSRAETRQRHRYIRFRASYWYNVREMPKWEIAERMGISRQTLYRIMAGHWEYNPPLIHKPKRKIYYRRKPRHR